MIMMPAIIKNKLRQLQKTCEKIKFLESEVCKLIESYGVDISTLCDNAEKGEIWTQGLTYIINAEGNVEENIELVEEVFLYYVNEGENNVSKIKEET